MDTRTLSAAARIARDLKRGLETRNAALLTSLYAQDCEHVVVNRNAPPSHPHVVRGREALGALWHDVCEREMTHHVDASLVDGDRVALRTRCVYADGTQVATAVFVDVVDGLVKRSFELDSWDE